ncbi:MAG: leucyl aminopeptidase family protein [Gammaproteobacteria bacterium]|nr:leucyl aminopeptidase family protein [Gammaproteobacteria bacterium]
MSEIRPVDKKMQVIQSVGTLTRAATDKLDELIVVTPHNIPALLWKKIPDGKTLGLLSKRIGQSKPLRSRLNNQRGTGVSLRPLIKSGQQDDPAAYPLLKWAGEAAATALAEQPKMLGIIVLGLTPAQTATVINALLLAVHAHSFQLPGYQSKKPGKRGVRKLSLLGLEERLDLDRGLSEAHAINLARWLTALPPNKLTAGTYRKAITELAADYQWKSTFYNQTKLKKLGAGAFLAVSQGNADKEAGILRLQYRPAGAGKKPKLALVGKGIIFDTGGNNLKPFKSMLDMHEDMGGSAVAVATLQALTELEFPYPVDCWLAITENRIGPTAYKSRDIVTAINGKTIEVIHTDAEGRMVLADTLTLAGSHGADLIIDYATLTGACHYALTDRYSGVFSNRAPLNNVMTQAGLSSGERVWPFPMDADFDDELKSKVADILQCSVGGEADQILAARFLQRFVPDDTPWIHIDLSAVTNKSGLGQIPAGVTGFGVRFTLNLLYEQAENMTDLLGDSIPVNAT